MKKIITGSVLGCVLFTSAAFADYEKPMLISAPIEISSEQPLGNTMSEYEIILRNNIITSDFEYNNSHYFTSKIKTDAIIIPKELQEKAKKIYFLIEQGSNRMYYAKGGLEISADTIETVSDEYNYKIVDFIPGKKEYIFNNKDLLKEFESDKYYNVNITLMAELTDGKKIELSNATYISISNKENVLQNIYNNSQLKDNLFYGYYNSNDLEIYLKGLSEKMTRVEYKKLLSKADSKIRGAINQNEKEIDDMLASIKQDSDFEKYVSKYNNYSETRNLLSNLGSAVTNQLQNIRAFDAIDAILK